MNRCNGCTLCCKVLEVKGLAPAGEDCQHCIAGKGCAVWKGRPSVCRSFRCLWYTTPQFGEDLRPDQCGVLFEPGGDRVVLANTDPERPSAWREGVGWAFIKRCLRDGYAVIVQVETTKHFLIPEGQEPSDIWRRVSEDARKRGFV